MADGFQVDGPICFYNIGKKQRKIRRDFGYKMIALGVAIGIILILVGINPLWRIGLFLLFLAGGIGLFQAYEKT